MAKRIMLTICVCIVTSLYSSYANAGLVQRVLEIGVYHHLGNDTVDWMKHPDPEGTKWAKSFLLSSIRATMATIVVRAADLQYADICINGVCFGIPTVTDYDASSNEGFNRIYRNIPVSVPGGLFKDGTSNTILIQSKQDPLNPTSYDDFEISALYIYFQQ